MGFPHNNCGETCVRAGQKQWIKVLEVFPDKFTQWEKDEEEIRDYLEKDVAILRSRIGGVSRPLTLKELRETYTAKTCTPPDVDEDASCACIIE